MKQTEKNGEAELDLLQLLHALWEKAWVIVLAAVLCGSAAFVTTRLFVTPLYQSQIIMYVNNKNPSETKQSSISQGDLYAAQHLVDTYTVFLQSRTTLDEVRLNAKLPYTYEKLAKMVSAESVNETEAFRVVVTSKNPEEAALIANTIGSVLPGKIVDFIPGSSAKVVDYAVAAEKPSSPNVLKNAVLGAAVGFLVSCAAIVILKFMDHQIHDSDYLTQNYDLPVLAVIPDLASASGDRYGYYKAEAKTETAHSKKGGNRHA